MVKDKISLLSEAISLANSFYCEVVFDRLPDIVPSGEKRGGWEFNFNEGIKINLKDQLDTKKIVENAADLNLKLMKWRQAPGLELEPL